jgi:hypothetical protein
MQKLNNLFSICVGKIVRSYTISCVFVMLNMFVSELSNTLGFT